jgi:DNA-binding beta-propeller fold protein YncE
MLAVGSSPYRVLDFFNAGTGDKLGRISDMVAEPHEIATDEARRRMYVTHTYRSGGYKVGAPGHEISVVDVDARSVVDVIDISPYIAPHDIEYNAANDEIYASVEENDAGNGVVIIDPHERRVTGRVPTPPGTNSHWLAVPPDGHRCYVTHKEQPMLSAVDLHRRQLIGTVELPGGAEEIDVSPDGRHVYTLTPQQTPPAEPGSAPSRLVKIDASRFEIVGEIELDAVVVALRVAPDGRVLVSRMHAYDESAVAAVQARSRRSTDDEGVDAAVKGGSRDPLRGSLDVIDPASMTIAATVELDRMSFTVRTSPDSSLGYVANAGTGTLSMVDLTNFRVIRTLDCTPDPKYGGTHGLALISLAVEHIGP